MAIVEINMWIVAPFRDPGLCRCGEVTETFTVSDKRTALFELCSQCAWEWAFTNKAVR